MKKKIYQEKSKFGFYEKGLCYKKGCFMYSEIPELQIIKQTTIEILFPSGIKEDIETDQRVIEYLRKQLNIIENTLINTNWEKEYYRKKNG